METSFDWKAVLEEDNRLQSWFPLQQNIQISLKKLASNAIRRKNNHIHVHHIHEMTLQGECLNLL
jgi:hypothetical protein